MIEEEDKPIRLSLEDANQIYYYLWYMLAHKDDNITFRYVPPEYRNREALQKACDNVMYETIRVTDNETN